MKYIPLVLSRLFPRQPWDPTQVYGIVERAIQSVTAQARVMLDALEAKWKLNIPYYHPVIGFLVEYSAFLPNIYEVGKDGRTSFERCKGKRARIVGIEFGESVMWKKTFGGGALG